jgi:hypothetical protein
VIGLLFCCGGTSFARETLPPLTDGKAPQSYEALWAGFDPRAAVFETNFECCETFFDDDAQERDAAWNARAIAAGETRFVGQSSEMLIGFLPLHRMRSPAQAGGARSLRGAQRVQLKSTKWSQLRRSSPCFIAQKTLATGVGTSA